MISEFPLPEWSSAQLTIRLDRGPSSKRRAVVCSDVCVVMYAMVSAGLDVNRPGRGVRGLKGAAGHLAPVSFSAPTFGPDIKTLKANHTVADDDVISTTTTTTPAISEGLVEGGSGFREMAPATSTTTDNGDVPLLYDRNPSRIFQAQAPGRRTCQVPARCQARRPVSLPTEGHWCNWHCGG